MTWRLKWLMWRWAVSTFGYRKAFRMWRHGMKGKRLRLYRSATYGKVPSVDAEIRYCPRCGDTYLVFYPPSAYDSLKYHLQYCEGKSEDD